MSELKNITSKRSGSIDLFKTISMLMVVVLHLLGHGGGLKSLQSNSANWFILSGIESVCIIAVNCFALTTGFLYVGKKIKIKNILNLYLQVLFFSLGIALIFFVLKKEPFSVRSLLNFLLPIASKRYWYFSAYFILFLIMPLLNVVLEYADKRFLLAILGGAVILFGVYAFVATMVFGDTFGLQHGYSFIWLAILYLFGGAIKKYEIYSKLKSSNWLLLYLASTILSFACGIIFSALKSFTILPYMSSYIFLFNILSSLFLLMFFASIEIKSNKVLSFLAKNSFGVYLLHEHTFIRNAFITDKLTFLTDYNPLLAVLIVLGCAIAIYIIGSVIEFIRQLIFRLIKINKLTEKIDEKIVTVYNKISKDKDTETENN